MTLDMSTAVIIYILVNYICMFLVGNTWRRTKSKFQGIFLIFIDFIFQTAGLTLASLRPVLPPFYSILLANILMFTGPIFLLFGLAQSVNVSIHKKPYGLLSTFFILAYGYYTFITPDIRVRLILFATLLLPVFAHTAFVIFIKAAPKDRKYAFGVGSVHVLFIIVFSLRALYGFFGNQIPDYFHTPLTDTLFVIISLLLTIVLTFSLEHMLGMKLMDEIDAYIAEKEILLNQTQKLAETDPLTQLYNRRKIETILKTKINGYHQLGIPFTVLIADIDHFKNFNDTYGHNVGDEALIHVANTLQENIRTTDAIGRWGGEEFIIILKNTNLKTGFEIGQKLVDQIQTNKCSFLNEDNTLTISIGIAEMTKDSDQNTIIQRADDALYKAKRLGRNRIESID